MSEHVVSCDPLWKELFPEEERLRFKFRISEERAIPYMDIYREKDGSFVGGLIFEPADMAELSAWFYQYKLRREEE